MFALNNPKIYIQLFGSTTSSRYSAILSLANFISQNNNSCLKRFYHIFFSFPSKFYLVLIFNFFDLLEIFTKILTEIVLLFFEQILNPAIIIYFINQQHRVIANQIVKRKAKTFNDFVRYQRRFNGGFSKRAGQTNIVFTRLLIRVHSVQSIIKRAGRVKLPFGVAFAVVLERTILLLVKCAPHEIC